MQFWKDGDSFELGNITELTGNFPASRISGKKAKIVFFNADHDLFYSELEISGFRNRIFIPETGLVFFTYKVAIIHRGIDAGAPHGQQYPIGLGNRVMFRRATTEAGLTGSFAYFDNTISGGQIMDFTHRKYTQTCLRAPMAVDAGYWYEFSLSGGSHTDAGTRNGADGSAEINSTSKSYLLVEYEASRSLS